MRLCLAHQAAATAWVDWIGTDACRAHAYRHGGPVETVYERGDGGVNVARTAARTEENRQARAHDTYRLVATQLALVRRACSTGTGCTGA